MMQKHFNSFLAMKIHNKTMMKWYIYIFVIKQYLDRVEINVAKREIAHREMFQMC